MESNDRPRRLARLTMGAVAAATLVVAGCSGGGEWPTSGGVVTSPTPSAAAPGTPSVPTPVGDPAGGQGGTGGADGRGSVGGGAGGGNPGGGSGTGGNPSRCTTAELRGSLGPADGAAGSVNQTLILTNVGARTCLLRGFPGVSYVGGDGGAQVGPSAAMSGPRGGDIRLGVGGSAGAELKLVNVGNYEPAACRPVPVRGLRVYPPGDTASLFVAREGTGCSATPPGDQLTVQTLTAR